MRRKISFAGQLYKYQQKGYARVKYNFCPTTIGCIGKIRVITPDCRILTEHFFQVKGPGMKRQLKNRLAESVLGRF